MTLQNYNEFKIKDLAGSNDLVLFVNWHEGSPGKIKLKMGEHTAVVSLQDLYSFVFLACDEEQQSQLLPVRQTTIHKYVKQHRVIAKKNIKRGEQIVVNCEIDVPITVAEGLTGLLAKNKSLLIH